MDCLRVDTNEVLCPLVEGIEFRIFYFLGPIFSRLSGLNPIFLSASHSFNTIGDLGVDR